MLTAIPLLIFYVSWKLVRLFLVFLRCVGAFRYCSKNIFQICSIRGWSLLQFSYNQRVLIFHNIFLLQICQLIFLNCQKNYSFFLIILWNTAKVMTLIFLIQKYESSLVVVNLRNIFKKKKNVHENIMFDASFML